MGIYITKDGTTVNAKTYGEHPKLSPGHHWTNDEPLGEAPVWREVPGQIASVEPMRPTLFGYDEAEFMAKQYKR
jgi:hypothetical protein